VDAAIGEAVMGIKVKTNVAAASLAALFVMTGGALAQVAAPPTVPAPPAAAAPPPAANAAGTDLSGVACRWQQRSDVPAERGAPPSSYIFCGDTKRPVGTVTAAPMPLGLPDDAAARHKAFESAAEDTAIARDDATRITCTKGQWSEAPGGLDLFLQPCAVNDSEWPQVVAIVPTGDYVFRASGLPSALPAYLAEMKRLSHGAGKTMPDAAALRARLTAVAGERWLKPTPGDYDNYTELSETARIEASRKNYGAAEGHYRNALAILTKVFGEQSPGAGLLLMELALQVSNQERFDEAAALFRRADPIIQQDGTTADRARFLLYESFDAANRGNFRAALEYADNSANAWRAIINETGSGLGGDVPGIPGSKEAGADSATSAERGELAFALDLQAEMAYRLGDLAQADAAAEESAEILSEEHDLPPWWRAEVLTTVGEVRAAEGRMDAAEDAFRAALVLDTRLFGNTAPTAATYLVLGRVFSQQKMYPESVRAYRLGLDILRRDPVARAEIVPDQITPFIVAANGYAASKPDERAHLDADIFEASQLIGKTLVDDTVNRVAARLAQAAPAIAGLVDQLEHARRARDAARLELAQEVTLPDDQRGSDREQVLMSEINADTQKAAQLRTQIETKFPDYAKYATPGPASLKEAQAALAPDEALLMVESGRERSFVVLARKDRLVARPIALDEADIADAVSTLRKAFVVHDRQIDAFDTEKSYRLYHALLGGVEQDLAGVDHLVVVPTGPLASLPLGLLVTEPPKPGAQRDYVQAQWLLKRMAISEAPSARAFLALRQQASSTEATRALFAVANPDFARGAAGGPAGANGLEALENQCRDEGPVPARLINALPPLPDTADEVRKVAAILHADNGSILMGDEATKPRVTGAALGDYRVLYFATHGLLPTALRCQSEPALVLAPPATPATSRADDGVLDASEVAELHLNADLVVLSACNTASAGGQFGGESLSGLAGAFFHAGARSVLASHWEVPSEQTVQLMTGLFQRLGPNLNGGVAEALRQSQLALASKPETAHPFFWAAFTLIGDGGAASARRSAAIDSAGTVASTTDSERKQ
jgi:CHAT domain-containing protein